MTNNLESMGIYIHVPFCLHKCSYCDFYSLPGINPELYERYIDCLTLEISRSTCEFRSPFRSIYFGGGTPSLLDSIQLERLIAAIYRCFQPDREPEVTIEVNPATVTRQTLREYRQMGINRLSIGVQSFADAELRILGRLHNAEQAVECLDWASQAGFENVNIDLIYGLPGQSQEAWLSNLRRAGSLHPQHISAYLLQLDPATPLAHQIAAGELSLPDDETQSELYYLTRDFLQERGYRQYEISNFAIPGYECDHNLIYWKVGTYLGIGVGAVSFDGRQRTLNSPPLEAYMDSILAGDLTYRQILETMDFKQKMAEAVVMGLRLTQGINREDFQKRFGVDLLTYFEKIIRRCQAQGLLEVDNNIYLSSRAYFISNQVLCQFMS